MGDRGNICIKYEGGEKIYFYTHWDGSFIKQTVQSALRKNWRWDDPAYLARIIFCELVGNCNKEETGFGIAPYICDNEHDIVEVDCLKKTINVVDDRSFTVKESYTFKEFCDLPLDGKE